MSDRQLSTAADFQLVEQVVEFPWRGGTARVLIRALEPHELIVATQGVPEIATAAEAPAEDVAEQDPGELAEWAEKATVVATAVCRHGIVEPSFAFDGPDPAKADWRAVPFHIRMLLFTRILELTGVGEVAAALASFLPGSGQGAGAGGKGGDGGDGAGEVRGDAAAPGAGVQAADGG